MLNSRGKIKRLQFLSNEGNFAGNKSAKRITDFSSGNYRRMYIQAYDFQTDTSYVNKDSTKPIDWFATKSE